jgi:flagellar biosynthesis protein FlhG
MTRNSTIFRRPIAARGSPVIIPVASGKGGVGKSFLTANLAIALAEMNHSTIAIDLDLGGSNLHTFLGLANRYPGVGDFIHGAAPSLDGLLVETGVPNLRFLPGDGRTPFLANLGSAQKQKLIRHLRSLPAEYILLDLAAGAAFNTLDFFACASAGILVTTPDLPSAMGMQVFLKNHLLRCIDQHLSLNGFRMLRPLFKSLLQQPMAALPATLKGLKNRMMEEGKAAEEAFSQAADGLRPRVVFNMGAEPEESRMALGIRASLAEVLGIEPDFFGFVFRDPGVHRALTARRPFLTGFRESLAARNIFKIAERIVRYWRQPIPDCAARMIDHTFQVGAGLKDASAAQKLGSPGAAWIRSGASRRPTVDVPQPMQRNPAVYSDAPQAWKAGAPRRLS